MATRSTTAGALNESWPRHTTKKKAKLATTTKVTPTPGSMAEKRGRLEKSFVLNTATSNMAKTAEKANASQSRAPNLSYCMLTGGVAGGQTCCGGTASCGTCGGYGGCGISCRSCGG